MNLLFLCGWLAGKSFHIGFYFGLRDVRFAEGPPFWIALGYKG